MKSESSHLLMKQVELLKKAIEKKTIVSIQPVPNSPLDKTEIIVAMALAAEQAGTPAVRIESVANVQAVSQRLTIPIIGLVKHDLLDSPVRITPYIEDVQQLAKAGAKIIAFDATDRVRPKEREVILNAILQENCIAMADCSCFADGQWAAIHGAHIISSTLSGYTTDQIPEDPDLMLVKQFAQAGFFTIAEGRYNTPELATLAIQAGAVAVTVGSAITRLELVTQWFNHATMTAPSVPVF